MTNVSTQSEIIQATLSILVKFIKPFIGIIVGYLLIHKKNIPVKERARQILMPVIAVAYCVLSLIGVNIFLQKVNVSKEWETFRIVINSILSVKGQKPLISSFQGGVIIYLNIILLLLFWIVKLIAISILNRTMENTEVMNQYAGDYYMFSMQHSMWFLRPQWRGFQKLMSALARVSLVLASGLLCYSWVYEEKTDVPFFIYPYILVIIFEEISNALSGYTEQEYENLIIGDDAVVINRAGGYHLILPIYEKLFGSVRLASHVGTDYSLKQGPTDYLESLKEKDNQVDLLAAHYFEQQRKDGFSLDVDHMHGTVQLLHRQSVIFMDPFYRDLTKYVLLPLVDSIIKGYKVLVLIGNRDIAEDVTEWIHDMIKDYTGIKGIWRVEVLGKEKEDCDVGILDFPSLYDTKIQETNRAFFQGVSLCILVESSNMIPTGQIGLGQVVREMNRQEQAPVFCIIDRASDGLVDTFSHVLQTNITNVIAAPIPRCLYTIAAWDADGDFQRQKWFKRETRFLGNGVELAAVAIKNQIPKVRWFGGRVVPVKDVEWIAGQYYSIIADYAHLSKQQTALAQRLEFVTNYWSASQNKEEFLIVEDQYCNMFEALRMFLSRGESQSFVNVLSGSYLLRDYMRYNMQMFMSDPKAIPSILPDYARTERNTILQLILRMAAYPVEEHEIEHELSLLDIEIESVNKALESLIEKYTLVKENVLTRTTKHENLVSPTSEEVQYYHITPGVFDKYFGKTLQNAYYVVENDKFEKEYVDAKMYSLLTQCVLPGQFTIVNGKYYQVESIGEKYGVLLRRASDRYDHRAVYRQCRHYYFEQGIDGESGNTVLLSSRKVMDLEISRERRSFRVVTEGYLDMKAYHDLKSARLVDFTKDPAYSQLDMNIEGLFGNINSRNWMERAYHNKEVLRISLPDASIDMRMTLAMLLQELFRTIYPDNWQYLAVISEKDESVEGMLNYMTYDADGLPLGTDIFIVEDSDIDLGLLDSIDHNLMRYFGILMDYIEWHFDQMSEGPSKDPLSQIELSKKEKVKGLRKAKKKGLRGLVTSIVDVFKKNPEDQETEDKESKKKGDDTQPEKEASTSDSKDTEKTKEESAEKKISNTSGLLQSDEAEEEDKLAKAAQAEADDINVDDQVKEVWEKPIIIENERLDETGTMEDELLELDQEESLYAVDGMIDDFEKIPNLLPLPWTRYRQECFLKFGFAEIDDRIAIDDVRGYLTARGFGTNEVREQGRGEDKVIIDVTDNALTNARLKDIDNSDWLDIKTDGEDVVHCDFCGKALSGVSYEQLVDGRVRCNDCAATAIEGVEEFQNLFGQHIVLMQTYYRISFRKAITIQVTDAKTVAKKVGMVYKPTSKYDGRVLGFAQKKRDHFNLVIENGSPRLSTIETTIHEMTHIWQYLNWSDKKVFSTYGRTRIANDLLYEGMTVWASIQYLYLIGETAFAQMQEINMERRLENAIIRSAVIFIQTGKRVIDDAYPFGLVLYKNEYPFMKNMQIPSKTPFKQFPPLEETALFEESWKLVEDFIAKHS